MGDKRLNESWKIMTLKYLDCHIQYFSGEALVLKINCRHCKACYVVHLLGSRVHLVCSRTCSLVVSFSS